MLLHQEEAMDPAAEALKHLRQQTSGDVSQGETEQVTLSPALLKDIHAARIGRQLTYVMIAAPFLLMAVTPWMTPARLMSFMALIGVWIVLLIAGVTVLRRIGRRLAKVDDPRASGALLDVLKTNGVFPQRSVQMALIRLLPRLKASDSRVLSQDQLRFTYMMLAGDQESHSAGRGWKQDLKIAVLKALEQVGDAESLTVVKKVAQSDRLLAVRQAAQECLPFLQARVEQQRSREFLLRSASSTVHPEEALLRPAGGGPDTNPEELLRAAD